MSGDYFDEVVAGPCNVYVGALGVLADMPDHASINSVPAASAYTAINGTNGGVTWSNEDTGLTLTVDQVPYAIDDRVQQSAIQVVTTIAAASLANLAIALNTTIGATGANFVSFAAPTGIESTQRQPVSLVLDGFAPTLDSGLARPRRRFYLARAKQFGKVQAVMARDKQVGWDVTWNVYYVDDQTPPYDICDQTAA